ncbi:hypothetical protein [Vibrio anguillarum]|nr:hypothetical protein [Vibrio anguillarum]
MAEILDLPLFVRISVIANARFRWLIRMLRNMHYLSIKLKQCMDNVLP